MEEEFGDNKDPHNCVLTEIVFSLATVLAAGIGIYGAIRYNVHAVAFTGTWLLINWACALVNAITFCSLYEDPKKYDPVEQECYVSPESVTLSFFIAAAFVYPHIFFVKEVKQGTMSEENCPREKFSCCCT